ncbi:hypothetical protein J4205_01570 [Candidatus Pacearchaeota archaeon]|nr:hypothetical protein [Candidatus Pacearchaeota archaeon]
MEAYWLWPGIIFIIVLVLCNKAFNLSTGISLVISILLTVIVGLIIYRREN